MVKLDYTEASVFGGMPRTQDTLSLDEYMYVCGFYPPRHPVPAVIQSNCYCGWRESVNPCDCDCGLFKRSYPMPSIHVGAYVLACGMVDSGAMVLWFADHEVIAV